MGSKPLHPATVHFPIGLILTSFALDAGQLLAPLVGPSLPAAVLAPLEKHMLPPAAHVSVASYVLLCAGLLSAVPAVLSGVPQALALSSRAGFASPKTRLALLHAAVSDAVIAGTACVWLCKRGGKTMAEWWGGVAGGTGSGSRGVGGAYVAGWDVVAVEILLGLVLCFAANLGGRLVYNHGVGLVAGKGAADARKKKQ